MIQEPVGEKTQGNGTPAFSKDGAIGSMFKADGAVGGTAEKVGGPFAKDGVVGLVFSFHILTVLLLAVSKLWGELGRSSQVADESSGWTKAAEFWVERLLEEFPNVV
jgi:hypothetical protein